MALEPGRPFWTFVWTFCATMTAALEAVVVLVCVVFLASRPGFVTFLIAEVMLHETSPARPLGGLRARLRSGRVEYLVRVLGPSHAAGARSAM